MQIKFMIKAYGNVVTPYAEKRSIQSAVQVCIFLINK